MKYKVYKFKHFFYVINFKRKNMFIKLFDKLYQKWVLERLDTNGFQLLILDIIDKLC